MPVNLIMAAVCVSAVPDSRAAQTVAVSPAVRCTSTVIIGVLRPVGPHVSTPMATMGAHHAVPERADRRVVRQVVIGIHDDVVVAVKCAAVDEQPRDAMAA